MLMPEPNDAFRDAMKWTVKAVVAAEEVRARRRTLQDGLSALARAQLERGESFAAGNVVGDNAMREGVAVQLVTAATGL